MAVKGELPRVRASFTLAVGAVAVLLGAALPYIIGSTARVGAAFAFTSIGGTVAALLAALLSRPRAIPLALPSWVIAAALALTSSIWAVLSEVERGVLAPSALFTAGGLALAFGLMKWLRARAIARVPYVVLDRKQKVLLHRSEGEPAKVAAAAVAPGDTIEIGTGQVVPVDVTIVSGSGRVEEQALFGDSAARPRRPGDLLVAGSTTTIPRLVARVEARQDRSFLVRWQTLLRAMIGEMEQGARTDRVLALLPLLLAVAAGVLLILDAPSPLRASALLPMLSGLALAASGAPAVLALFAGRTGVLAEARRRGVVIASARDLEALSRVRRWFVDGALLSAPGSVEAVAFGDDDADTLLLVAHALLDGDAGPELASLARAIQDKHLAPLRSAALRRSSAVFHGTVRGDRWFMGPPAAVRSEEKVEIDPSTEGAISYLQDRGGTVWAIGRPDEGVIGAVRVTLEVDPDVKTAASALRAQLAPGVPEDAGRALAKLGGATFGSRAPKRRDMTILGPDGARPSAGSWLRAVEPRPDLPLELGKPPVVLAPAIANLPDFARAARKVRRWASFESVLLAVVPVVLAALLGRAAWLGPVAGTAIALLSLLWAARARGPRPRTSGAPAERTATKTKEAATPAAPPPRRTGLTEEVDLDDLDDPGSDAGETAARSHETTEVSSAQIEKSDRE